MLNSSGGMLKKPSAYGKSHSMTSSDMSGKGSRICSTRPSPLSSEKTTGAGAAASSARASGRGSSAAKAGTVKEGRISVIIKKTMTIS